VILLPPFFNYVGVPQPEFNDQKAIDIIICHRPLLLVNKYGSAVLKVIVLHMHAYDKDQTYFRGDRIIARKCIRWLAQDLLQITRWASEVKPVVNYPLLRRAWQKHFIRKGPWRRSQDFWIYYIFPNSLCYWVPIASSPWNLPNNTLDKRDIILLTAVFLKPMRIVVN